MYFCARHFRVFQILPLVAIYRYTMARTKASRIVNAGNLVPHEHVECISGRRIGAYRGYITTVSLSRKSCRVRNELDDEEIIEFRMSLSIIHI